MVVGHLNVGDVGHGRSNTFYDLNVCAGRIAGKGESGGRDRKVARREGRCPSLGRARRNTRSGHFMVPLTPTAVLLVTSQCARPGVRSGAARAGRPGERGAHGTDGFPAASRLPGLRQICFSGM